MDHSPAVCLRLITDLNDMLDHHCTLCYFFHDREGECDHDTTPTSSAPRAPSVLSDSSFYTAQASDDTRSIYSRTSRASFSSGSSTSTIKARILPKGLKRAPSLRRKTSPTEISLRELRSKQERQNAIRAKQSEEQLQHVYELQILAYLNGPFVELDSVAE